MLQMLRISAPIAVRRTCTGSWLAGGGSCGFPCHSRCAAAGARFATTGHVARRPSSAYSPRDPAQGVLYPACETSTAQEPSKLLLDESRQAVSFVDVSRLRTSGCRPRCPRLVPRGRRRWTPHRGVTTS